MRYEQFDRAFGSTPEAFVDRIDQTLRNLEEERPVKLFTMRTALVVMLLVVLLGTMAYAVIDQGLEWYYNNRFSAYQELEPEKYEAIIQNLKVVGEQDGQEDPLVKAEIREVAWLAEHNTLIISLAAFPADDEKYELHPKWNLDPDGSYLGKQAYLYPDDPEVREEHWLVTRKGFGPVKEMMEDGSKELLLFEASRAWLGTMDAGKEIIGDGSSMDAYVNENGEVMTVLEVYMEGTGIGGSAYEALTEGGGMTISIPYTVTVYSDDDAAMLESRYEKWLSFELKPE